MPAAVSTGVRSLPSCSETPVTEALSREAVASVLMLGERRYDLTHHALVMGICNRTPARSSTGVSTSPSIASSPG